MTALPRPVKAPTGPQLHCKSWLTEAAYRMIQNNLDPAVAENPDALLVYGDTNTCLCVIPAKRRRREPVAHDEQAYRTRNRVERLVGKVAIEVIARLVGCRHRRRVAARGACHRPAGTGP